MITKDTCFEFHDVGVVIIFVLRQYRGLIQRQRVEISIGIMMETLERMVAAVVVQIPYLTAFA